MTEKDKKVMKMMKLMKTDISFQDQAVGIAKAIGSSFGISDEELSDVLRDGFIEGYFKILDMDGLMSMVAPSYSTAFSEEEIDEMIVMFSTPVYQRFIAKTPEIMIDLVPIMGTWMANRMTEIEEYIEKFVEKMDKEDWQKED